MTIGQTKAGLQIRSAVKQAQPLSIIGDGRRPRILTVSQVAELLQIQRSSVYERTRKRVGSVPPLPVRRVGKYLRFIESEVLDWLLRLPTRRNGIAG